MNQKQLTIDEKNLQWRDAFVLLVKLPEDKRTKKNVLRTISDAGFDYVFTVLNSYTPDEWRWFLEERISAANFDLMN